MFFSVKMKEAIKDFHWVDKNEACRFLKASPNYPEFMMILERV